MRRRRYRNPNQLWLPFGISNGQSAESNGHRAVLPKLDSESSHRSSLGSSKGTAVSEPVSSKIESPCAACVARATCPAPCSRLDALLPSDVPQNELVSVSATVGRGYSRGWVDPGVSEDDLDLVAGCTAGTLDARGLRAIDAILGPERDATDPEVLASVQAALDALPRRQVTLVRAVLAGETQSQVARRTGVSRQRVCAAWGGAVRRIRIALEGRAEGEPGLRSCPRACRRGGGGTGQGAG